MAKLPNSQVVFRFRFGQGAGKGRARFENTSRAIAQNIAFAYANDQYDTMRKTLEQRLEQDLRAELTHLARLFRRHIIGVGGTKTMPSGTLDTVTKGKSAPTESIATSLPGWAPRNAEYLRQKRAATGNIKWFDNRGWKTPAFDARFSSRVSRKGRGPRNPGLLFKEMRQDVWETMFGPIRVRFFKKRNQNTPAVATIATARGTKIETTIGSIQVRALGRITPAMLPGFTGGRIRASASGNPGLIGLVRNYDPQLALRLGRMNNGIYRPTLEPFLGFFLTKAMPYAVTQRILKGTLGSTTIRA